MVLATSASKKSPFFFLSHSLLMLFQRSPLSNTCTHTHTHSSTLSFARSLSLSKVKSILK